MRSTLTLRMKRTIQIAIAMTMLAVPSGALALSGVTDAPAATTAGLHAAVTPRVARLGQAVTVRGTAPASAAGHRAVLESADSPRERMASAAGDHDRDRRAASPFRTQLRHSGYLRVIDTGPVASGSGVQAARSAVPAGSASAPQRVAVAARFAGRPRPGSARLPATRSACAAR